MCANRQPLIANRPSPIVNGPSSASTLAPTSTLGDLDFSQSAANVEARQRFKKVLPAIINVRTDGEQIFAFRRVQQSYQWQS